MALTSKLTAIADAIRAKTGGSAKLSLDDMPTAIASIESGVTPETPSINISSNGLITATANGKSGTKQLSTQAAKTVTPTTSSQTAVSASKWTTGAVTVAAIPSSYVQPSGSLNITENGTYDVKSKASVNVNVEGGGVDGDLYFDPVYFPQNPWSLEIPDGAVAVMYFGEIDPNDVAGYAGGYYVVIGAICDSYSGDWIGICSNGTTTYSGYGIIEYDGSSLNVVDADFVFVPDAFAQNENDMYYAALVV